MLRNRSASSDNSSTMGLDSGQVQSLSPSLSQCKKRDKNDKGLLPMRSLSKPDCVCHGFPQVLAVVQSLSESLQKDNANKKIAASSL